MISRYQSVQAETCDRGGLLLLLFDKILSELHRARESLSEPALVASFEPAVMKVQLGVMELDRTLNHQVLPELASSLHNLYLHILLLVGDAMTERQSEPLERASRLLGELRESFGQAARAQENIGRAV